MADVRTVDEFYGTVETAIPDLDDRLVCRVSRSLAPDNVFVAQRR